MERISSVMLNVILSPHKYFKSIDLPYIYKDLSIKNAIISSKRKVFATIGKGNTR